MARFNVNVPKKDYDVMPTRTDMDNSTVESDSDQSSRYNNPSDSLHDHRYPDGGESHIDYRNSLCLSNEEASFDVDLNNREHTHQKHVTSTTQDIDNILEFGASQSRSHARRQRHKYKSENHKKRSSSRTILSSPHHGQTRRKEMLDQLQEEVNRARLQIEGKGDENLAQAQRTSHDDFVSRRQKTKNKKSKKKKKKHW